MRRLGEASSAWIIGVVVPSALLASFAALTYGCSDTPLPSPTSDTQYDDPDDPGGGGTTVPTTMDAGVPNPPDAGGGKPVAMPNGQGGVGFDELRFAASLGKVLVPAGRTGDLDLLDPSTDTATPISGFSAMPTYDQTFTDGTTSADVGVNGIVFAIDRTNQRLDVVDTTKGMIVTFAALAGPPDIVRYSAPTNEVWVTEAGGIEIFALDSMSSPTHAALITVQNPPVGLEIDATNGRAYTHIAAGTTAAIGLTGRTVVEEWPNGCDTAEGLAIDATHGYVFAGCSEGKVVALDASNMGMQLGSLATAKGVDQIAYDPTRLRLYVPGTITQTMTVVSVGSGGTLSALGTIPVVFGAHCVAVDQSANAYLCDPEDGEIVVIHDPF